MISTMTFPSKQVPIDAATEIEYQHKLAQRTVRLAETTRQLGIVRRRAARLLLILKAMELPNQDDRPEEKEYLKAIEELEKALSPPSLRALAEEIDKALAFDLDRAGIEQREREAVELVELRAKVSELSRNESILNGVALIERLQRLSDERANASPSMRKTRPSAGAGEVHGARGQADYALAANVRRCRPRTLGVRRWR
jgi:hypothetical protein